MRLLHSLKSTQWVMWSSPLLLLVLVFTLSASTSSPPVRPTSPGAVASPSTTTSTTSAHLAAPPTTTSTAAAATTTTTTSTVAISDAATTRASGRRGVSSSNATVTSVGSFANAPAESASSGALRGSITPSLGVAVVPLAGPATWTLSASAALTATLQCGGQSVDVGSPFVVGAGENCQLTLAPVTTSETVTWQLTPTT